MEKNFSTNDKGELEKAKVFNLQSIIDYISNSVVSKTILRKPSGNVIAMSFDKGEELVSKFYPFDTFIEIIDGTAEVKLDKTKHLMVNGTGMVIPAHQMHGFNASERFKMITTVIKSGYED